MGEYVELPGVRTWYEVEGQGDPVVLPRGGFCANETWGPQRPEFAADHRTFFPSGAPCEPHNSSKVIAIIYTGQYS